MTRQASVQERGAHRLLSRVRPLRHDAEQARRGRRVLALTIAVLALLGFPAVAFAWSQNYALYEYFFPGGIRHSAANASLNWNETSFVTSGDGDRMQTTLCDGNYSNCYVYWYSTSGWLGDDRTRSYGRAKCNAWQYNYNAIYVNWCFVKNH